VVLVLMPMVLVRGVLVVPQPGHRARRRLLRNRFARAGFAAGSDVLHGQPRS
jgi:hypothetical protein